MDLPGLKYVNGTSTVASCVSRPRPSASSPTTRSRLTSKQDALLSQVVDQVKQLGGSPARMLFVLNRIDAYLSDRDPVASERDFANSVTDRNSKAHQ